MSPSAEVPQGQDAFSRALGKLKLGDWEQLSIARRSPFWPAFQKYLLAIQNKHLAGLHDRETSFSDTQYHRGSLDILREIVTLLEEGAQSEYDKRVAAASQRGSESST